MEILPDQRIVAAGYLRGALFVVRLLPGGELDPSFGGGDGKVVLVKKWFSQGLCCQGPAALDVLGDGSILVAGEVLASSGAVSVVVRFGPSGGLYRGFGRAGIVVLRGLNPFDIAVQGDGRILFAGSGFGRHRDKTSGNPVFAAARLRADGTLERRFGQGGVQSLSAGLGVFEPSARLPLFGSGFREEPYRPHLDPGRTSAAFAALTQPSGRVVLGGSTVLKREVKGPGPREYSYQTKLLLTRYRQSLRQR